MDPDRRAFYEIVAGLALLVLDVRNDAIVPDVLGYLLILFASLTLGRRDAAFALARWPAIVAGVASVMVWSSRALWPAFVQAFFEIALIWLLCSGVVRLAEAQENAPLARAAANARSLTVLAGTLNFAYAGLLYGAHIAIPYAGMVLLAFGWSVGRAHRHDGDGTRGTRSRKARITAMRSRLLVAGLLVQGDAWRLT